MLAHYNVKEPALRFASFEPAMKQSRGFQANEASDVIDNVLLTKRIKLNVKLGSMWDVSLFLYKLWSLCVERHISNNCLELPFQYETFFFMSGKNIKCRNYKLRNVLSYFLNYPVTQERKNHPITRRVTSEVLVLVSVIVLPPPYGHF